MKRVSIKAKGQAKPQAVDAWVQKRAAEGQDKEPMKRLTIDVPVSLHRRIKSQCGAQGLIMADEIRTLLDQRFPAGKIQA